MILIGLILYLWIGGGLAGAATLYDTRAGDHNNFTRIVFEFENFVQFMEPVIKKDGKLSVVFPNATSASGRKHHPFPSGFQDQIIPFIEPGTLRD
jgi:hypothetical protein